MKSHFKESKPVWTKEEIADRSLLVMGIKEFERVIISDEIEFFFKKSNGVMRVVMILPRHMRVTRSKIKTGE